MTPDAIHFIKFLKAMGACPESAEFEQVGESLKRIK